MKVFAWIGGLTIYLAIWSIGYLIPKQDLPGVYLFIGASAGMYLITFIHYMTKKKEK